MSDESWTATVREGRLQLDATTDLPEGTTVTLARPPAETPSPRCDVLLFVTTPTERQALRDVARHKGLPLAPVSGRFGEYLDLGQLHPQYRVFAVETEMGALQAGGAATQAILCPIETGARHIVAVGMAFGIDRQRQGLGDVLVATHLLAYDNVMVDTDADGRLPHIRYDRVRPLETSRAMQQLIRRHVDRSALGFGVHFGAMLTGSAQIRCSAYRDHLAAKLNKKLIDRDRELQKKKQEALSERIVGGEMEGAGLLAAPSERSDAPWLIVKGISDFADETHEGDSESSRRAASENAISLVLAALAGDRPDDQQTTGESQDVEPVLR